MMKRNLMKNLQPINTFRHQATQLAVLSLLLAFLMSACTEEKTPTLFTAVPSETSGVDFANNLSYTEEYNPYTYRNFYNGGGIALGDINNDGLVDLYFTGNLVDNKLYLNKGNFQFEDITAQAGVGGGKYGRC